MNPLFDVQGKVTIVTGGSRGIGEAIAQRFAEAGAKVVISSRKQDGLDAVAEKIRAAGGEVTPVAAHNGDKTALQNLVAQTVEKYGTVDVLINNAATNPHFGTLLEAEDSMWQKTIEVNLMGNVWLTQAAVKVMREKNGGRGGRIVNVASVVGLRPGRMQGIYSITKASVISLTQTLAMELAEDNIQVNAIAPGLVKTQFARAIWDNDVLLEGVLARTPQRRLGDPDDIAGVALFLASAASNFATGQVFVIDGGATIPMI
jgi:NAD(P)-dependent dehydrogenase (short-subunit alcohol dehydrogenase family)